MTATRRLLIGAGLILILAACSQQPATPTQPATRATTTPTLTVVGTSTPEIAVPPGVMQTPRAQDRATASPTPAVGSTTQAPTATAQPTLTSFPWMPSRADAVLPEGVVAQLGVGSVQVQSLSPSREFLVVNVNESAYMYQAMTLRRMWRARLTGLVTWLADGKRVGIGSVLYDAVTGEELAALPLDAHRVAWSPDGTLAATHDGGGLMVVWDVAAGQQLWSVPRPEYIQQHPGTGYYGWTVEMRFSPDGEYIASGYYWSVGDVGAVGCCAHVYSARTGGVVAELEGHYVSDPRLTWSRTGRYLAMSSNRDYERGVAVWDMATGEPLATDSMSDALSIEWSPDGCRFATGYFGWVTVWDCETGEALHQLRIPDVRFTSLSWSRDGALLAGGSSETPAIAVWDATSGQIAHSIELGGPLVGFGTDNDTFIGGLGVQNSAAIWRLDTPTPAQPTAYLRGLSGINSLAWSPDGTQIASTVGAHYGQRDGLITWDVATLYPTWDMEGFSFIDWRDGDVDNIRVDWSPDGAMAAVSTVGNYREPSSVRVIDLVSGEIRLRVESTLIPQATFSPDGSLLAVLSERNVIMLYSIATGVQLGQGTAGDGRMAMDFAWSPDGRQIAIASVVEDDFSRTDDPGGRVEVWDVESLQRLYTLEGLNGPALSVAWSPDGTRIAASGNTEVAIWAAGAGKATPDRMLYSLIEHGQRDRMGFTEIDWSPDGRLIAGAFGMPYTRFYCNGCGYGNAGLVMVWDAATAERVYRFEAHTDEVQTVAFSPDGSLLASGSLDGIIYVWDVRQ